MKLSEGDGIKCPACDEEWEGEVGDYVIPNKVGVDSEAVEQCGYCDVFVRVVKDPDGTFCVEEEAND